MDKASGTYDVSGDRHKADGEGGTEDDEDEEDEGISGSAATASTRCALFGPFELGQFDVVGPFELGQFDVVGPFEVVNVFGHFGPFGELCALTAFRFCAILVGGAWLSLPSNP